MDLVVDFTGLSGSSIYLRNFGPDSPFGGLPVDPGDVADEETTGQIMRFDVAGTAPTTDATVTLLTPLRAPIEELVPNGETRQLALFEGMDEYGRLMPMLGTVGEPDPNDPNALEGSLTWSDPITENPMKNDVEIWEVYNATGDAHPIHLHLVKFQILDRTPFTPVDEGTKNDFSHAGEAITGGWITVPTVIFPPDNSIVDGVEPNERGWKDTAVMLPGEVTRVIAKFDRNGRYVWHCHILSHEDHEMMRPFQVGPPPLPKQSGDVLASVTEFRLEQNYPNPFNPSTTINFSVPNENTLVSLNIYNALGQEVGTLINQVVPAGNHEVQFDATGLSSGVYFYTLTAGSFVESKKMALMK
jgi:spore coat protein A